MEALQIQQQQGDVSTMKGNKDSGYEFPAIEKHLVHVRLETKTFNQSTGLKTSVPSVQSFYPKEFDEMETSKHFAGMTVEVLHDPRSAKDQTTDKIQSALNGPVMDMQLEKPLDQFNRKELQKKYADMYKEDPGTMTDAELRTAILEKIEWFRGEEAAMNANKASEDAGGILNTKEGTDTTDKTGSAAAKATEEAAAAQVAATKGAGASKKA